MTKPFYYIIFAFIWLGLGLWNIIDGKSVAGFVCLAISNIQVVGCGIIMKLNQGTAAKGSEQPPRVTVIRAGESAIRQ